MVGYTIAVDFDGVIHKYSKGWDDGSVYDEPNEGAFESLQELHDLGYTLIIYTCRANNQVQLDLMVEWMGKWMKEKKCNFTFTCTPFKPVAKVYIDDRAIRFTNWKDMMNYF